MLVVLVFLFADSFDAPPPPPPLPPPVVAFVVLLPFFNASSFERVAATARLVLRTCVSPVSGSNTKIVPAEWTEGQVDDDEEVDDEEVDEVDDEDDLCMPGGGPGGGAFRDGGLYPRSASHR